jgi:hypothetical protein
MQTPTSGTVTGRYAHGFNPIPWSGVNALPIKKGYLFRKGTDLVQKQEGPFLTQSSFNTVAQAGDLVLILNPSEGIAPKLHSHGGDRKIKWRRLRHREDLIQRLQLLALIQ